ncbi:MAG: DUF2683 family protein [Ferruginibacter sp.]
MEAINITAYTNDIAQIDAIKAVLKALNIKFEVAKDKPYNPKFVTKILQSKQQVKQGKVTRVTKKELQKFLNI